MLADETKDFKSLGFFDLIALNKPAVTTYCPPATLSNHVLLMKNLSVWGTHADILALATYTKSHYTSFNFSKVTMLA